jgi:hypothetical protein
MRAICDVLHENELQLRTPPLKVRIASRSQPHIRVRLDKPATQRVPALICPVWSRCGVR